MADLDSCTPLRGARHSDPLPVLYFPPAAEVVVEGVRAEPSYPPTKGAGGRGGPSAKTWRSSASAGAAGRGDNQVWRGNARAREREKPGKTAAILHASHPRRSPSFPRLCQEFPNAIHNTVRRDGPEVRDPKSRMLSPAWRLFLSRRARRTANGRRSTAAVKTTRPRKAGHAAAPGAHRTTGRLTACPACGVDVADELANGDEFGPGSLRTNTDFYRISAYERTLLSTPAQERLIGSAGVTFVALHPTLTGQGKSNTEILAGIGYRQALPVPIVGLRWDHPLGANFLLRTSVDGGVLPKVDSLREEGGTLYVQQTHADANVGIIYSLGRRAQLELGYHFTYLFLYQTSHEDKPAILGRPPPQEPWHSGARRHARSAG